MDSYQRATETENQTSLTPKPAILHCRILPYRETAINTNDCVTHKIGVTVGSGVLGVVRAKAMFPVSAATSLFFFY
jgi:hypothetical protein